MKKQLIASLLLTVALIGCSTTQQCPLKAKTAKCKTECTKKCGDHCTPPCCSK